MYDKSNLISVTHYVNMILYLYNKLQNVLDNTQSCWIS
jgi:hypothetical protein